MKIQSLRGMSDLFPENLAKWHFLESKLFNIFNSFNTKEIRTPLLESTELFSRSVGNSSDIVNKELYSFLDRNQESISLRPEGSASVIRAIIQKKQEHEKHKLWYQGPMFRYERPQKGRFRQFHQIGVEYLGFEEGVSEFELISMILEINQSIGINDYTFKINHLGDAHAKENFCKSLVSFLKPNANELHEKDQLRLKSNPLRILDSKENSTIELLKNAPKFQDFVSDESKEFLEAIVDAFEDQCDIQIDQSLVRGLDYYNQTVFEVISNKLGGQDALCGGGRYDKLISQLGGEDIPAVGFAAGMERLIIAMNLENNESTTTDIYIINNEISLNGVSMLLADNIRKNLGVAVYVDTLRRSLKSQLRHSNKMKSKFSIILDTKTLDENTVCIKNMEKNSQDIIDFNNIISYFESE